MPPTHRLGLLLAGLTLAGCTNASQSALLSVTADGPVDLFDLYVRDESTHKVFIHTGWSDATRMGALDLESGTLRVGIQLPHPGDYTIVLAGVKGPLENTPLGQRAAAGSTELFWAARPHVDGNLELAAALLHVPQGDDSDRDLFPDATDWPNHVPQASSIAATLLDCDDKTDYPDKHLKASDINPLADEKCGNGIDEETCLIVMDPCSDSDNDGDPDDTDCAPNDPTIHHPITDPSSPHYDPYPESANCCGYNLGKTGSDAQRTFAPPLCHPGHCGSIDWDCSGTPTPCINDLDCDTYPAAAVQDNGCMAPPNNPPGSDCDDCDPSIHPGAPEICDGKDNNCNGLIDETCVLCDLDGDGYQRASRNADDPCPDANYKASGKAVDCNDEDRGIFPGSTGPNVPVSIPQLVMLGLANCDGKEGGTVACAIRGFCRNLDYRGMQIDEDCDGVANEGCPPATCDADGDGFVKNDPNCDAQGHPYDCDDTDPTVFPGAPENCKDAKVHDCGVAKQPCMTDADNDGWDATVDCNDNDPNVHPWATELCNGVDDDCDGLIDEGNPDNSGNPLFDKNGILRCTDSDIGQCGRNKGDCVCSGVSVASLHYDTSRTLCPTESADSDTGNNRMLSAARCYFAGQPVPEVCNGLDDDCDDDLASHTVDTTKGVATDCPGLVPSSVCCPVAMSTVDACTDTLTDPLNCGGCGNACSTNHVATVACDNQVCDGACATGYADCDMNKLTDGCEIDIETDPMHCGGCGNVCSSSHVASLACAAGLCSSPCASGYSDCNNNKLIDGCETHSDVDVLNCGGCGNACSANHIAIIACAGGQCTGACATGYADCDGNKLTNGCEIDTLDDPAHCGGCANFCSNNHVAMVLCTNGVCNGPCSAGYADCNNNEQVDGCETHIASDVNHCGGCGLACSGNNVPVPACTNGQCTGNCAAGFADCNNNKQTDGCETNIGTVSNCGGCGSACSTNHDTPTCVNSQCQLSCSSGYGNCDGMVSNGCETNITTDAMNCGGCGMPCSTNHDTPTCVNSQCQLSCSSGYGNCDGMVSNGCETDTTSDPMNCGACGVICSPNHMQTITCGAPGVCDGTCATGFADCNSNKQSDGCESDLSQPSTCGSCTNDCLQSGLGHACLGGGKCGCATAADCGTLGDTCNASNACQCGMGSPCTQAGTQCFNGACLLSKGQPCQMGTQCASGACTLGSCQ